MRSIWLGLLSVLCAGSLLANESSSLNAAQEITSATLLNYLGRIEATQPDGSKIYCSASRIGKRLILTARHCLQLEKGRLRRDRPAYFLPGYSRGQLAQGARTVRIRFAWVAGEIPTHPHGKDFFLADWAIGYLADLPYAKPEQNADFLRLSTLSPLHDPDLILAAYGSDRKDKTIWEFPKWESGKLTNGKYQERHVQYSTFSSTPGSSGGAILVGKNGKWVQVGINVAVPYTEVVWSRPPFTEVRVGRSVSVAIEELLSAVLAIKHIYGEFHPESEFRRFPPLLPPDLVRAILDDKTAQLPWEVIRDLRSGYRHQSFTF